MTVTDADWPQTCLTSHDCLQQSGPSLARMSRALVSLFDCMKHAMWGAGVPSRPQSAGRAGSREGGYVGASSLSLLRMLTGSAPDAPPRLAPSEAPRYTCCIPLLPIQEVKCTSGWREALAGRWGSCNQGNGGNGNPRGLRGGGQGDCRSYENTAMACYCLLLGNSFQPCSAVMVLVCFGKMVAAEGSLALPVVSMRLT